MRFLRKSGTPDKPTENPQNHAEQTGTTSAETEQVNTPPRVDAAQLTPLDWLRRPRAVYEARYDLPTWFWSMTFAMLMVLQLCVMVPVAASIGEAHPVLLGWIVVCFDAQRNMVLMAMFGFPMRHAECYWLEQENNAKPLKALGERRTVVQTLGLWAGLNILIQALSESGGIAPIYQRVAALPFDLVGYLSAFSSCLTLLALLLLIKSDFSYAPYAKEAKIR